MKKLQDYVYLCENLEDEMYIIETLVVPGGPAPQFYREMVEEAFPNDKVMAVASYDNLEFEAGTLFILPTKKTNIFLV